MKKILIAVFAGMMFSTSMYAQKKITVYNSVAYPDNSGDRLHKVANDFATRVGGLLKEEFPMRIDSTSLLVKMECYNDTIKLSYSVTLVECDTNDAHYYFDRRGALSKDVRPYVAGIDAETRCYEQSLVVARAFKKKYNAIVFDAYVDVNVKCGGYTYALSEYFLAAKR